MNEAYDCWQDQPDSSTPFLGAVVAPRGHLLCAVGLSTTASWGPLPRFWSSPFRLQGEELRLQPINQQADRQLLWAVLPLWPQGVIPIDALPWVHPQSSDIRQLLSLRGSSRFDLQIRALTAERLWYRVTTGTVLNRQGSLPTDLHRAAHFTIQRTDQRSD